MPDDPKTVALLAYFAQEASVTRPEAAMLLGITPGKAAGIHHRDHLKGDKEKIGPWPRKLVKARKANRRCQLPIGDPLIAGFDLCGKPRDGGDSLRCEEHKGHTWRRPA